MSLYSRDRSVVRKDALTMEIVFFHMKDELCLKARF